MQSWLEFPGWNDVRIFLDRIYSLFLKRWAGDTTTCLHLPHSVLAPTSKVRDFDLAGRYIPVLERLQEQEEAQCSSQK